MRFGYEFNVRHKEANVFAVTHLDGFGFHDVLLLSFDVCQQRH